LETGNCHDCLDTISIGRHSHRMGVEVHHTFPDPASNHYYEVDFLITRKNKICPIEVKSSGYKTHPSLDAFSKKYHERILNKYLVYTKDFRKDGDVLCIPPMFVPYI